MATTEESTLKVFEFKDGTVTGVTGASDVKDFAADFQGLRHFADKIGEALELSPVWLGGMREADFTHLWNCTPDGNSGKGAIIASAAPFFELLQHISTEES
jgi:hypothetical protein